jgi:alkylated DNA repair protein (DNA oxidative demethylase)
MDLFSFLDVKQPNGDRVAPLIEPLAEGACVFKGFALAWCETGLADLEAVVHQAPYRHMMTRMGFALSAAMSNCGPLGWVSDRRGYRYSPVDPETSQPWPAMPTSFKALAVQAADLAGYTTFEPDACLINCYKIGARMGLHQDKDEKDLEAPIVSVSLGLPATFLFGGASREDPVQKVQLDHGDVVVWGGPSRLFYHGIAPLKKGHHPLLGGFRVNLTFRKVL